MWKMSVHELYACKCMNVCLVCHRWVEVISAATGIVSQTATDDADSSSPAVPMLSQIWVLEHLAGNSTVEVTWSVLPRCCSNEQYQHRMQGDGAWLLSSNHESAALATSTSSSLYSNNDKGISVFIQHLWQWLSIAARKLCWVDVVIVKRLR